MAALFLFRTHYSILEDADADLLRDVALKYEKGGDVSLDEAYKLMVLASRERPQGKFIQKKVKQYYQDINKS